MRRETPPPGAQRLFEVEPLPGDKPPIGQAQLFEFGQLPGRPVGGAGLFVDELVLGPGNLHAADEQAICAHLVAVARARRIPLHVTVAWNALYYGYDPSIPGYNMATSPDPDPIPLVAGSTAEAVPVGALVQFTSEEGKRHEEWAEVVYKEGRPSGALRDGLVRPEFSGATGAIEHAGHGDASSNGALREMLVLDFAPFGPIRPSDVSWLDRTRNDNDRVSLDTAGHVTIDALYSVEGAQSSDAEYFCEWVLEHHYELMARGWLGAVLDDPDNREHLGEAMELSVRAVAAVMERSEEFCEWGGYWYLKEDLDALRADASAPGGQSDAGHMLASFGSVPRRDRVAYHPLSPGLEQLVGSEALRFERYVRYVIYANVLVAETLARRAPDGVLPLHGNEVVVRLDDGWLYGGTWRAEVLDGKSICPLVGFEPTMTLALGANNEADDHHQPLPVESRDADDDTEQPRPEADTPDDEGEEDVAPGEPLSWSAVLRESHRDQERLFVHPDANLVPGPNGHVVLRLAHSGEIEDAERVQMVDLAANGGWLHPVQFPLDFFTGIRLSCLAQKDGSVVWVSTEALVTDEGGYGFAFDRSVVDPTRPRQREPRLVDRAMRTIDRFGEDMGERWRRLDADSIAELIFGPEVGGVGAGAVSDALSNASDDVTSCDDDGMWWHHAGTSGRRLFEPSRPAGGIFAASANLAASVARARSRHRVVMHLRALTVSERARPEVEAEYLRLRERAPNRRGLPLALPLGYTFVVSHSRGGSHD